MTVGQPYLEDHRLSDNRAADQPARQSVHASVMAHGLAVFAGVIMIMVGAIQRFNGLVAVFQNEFYVSTPNYIFYMDVSCWAEIHLLLGVAILLARYRRDVRPRLGSRGRDHPGRSQRAPRENHPG